MPGFRSPLGFAQAREPELRALVAKPGGPTDEELDRFAESKGLASWSVELQFYGPEKTIAGSWEYVQRAHRRVDSRRERSRKASSTGFR